MSTGDKLARLIKHAEKEGVTMAELGRRGGSVASARRGMTTNKYGKIAQRYSDEQIQAMPWNR